MNMCPNLNAVAMAHGHPHQTILINQREEKTLAIPLSRFTRKTRKEEE